METISTEKTYNISENVEIVGPSEKFQTDIKDDWYLFIIKNNICESK